MKYSFFAKLTFGLKTYLYKFFISLWGHGDRGREIQQYVLKKFILWKPRIHQGTEKIKVNVHIQ